jgi:uncharacterized protein (DUF2236 family)
VTSSVAQEGLSGGGPGPLGPESLVWRIGFPRAGLLVAGRALVLQTAHPVIGAGVRDFSDFPADPWGRLDRTLRSLQLQLFGGSAAVAEAARLRRLHASFRGTGFDGATYDALDPDAYAWVHLSNFDSMLAFHRWFGPSLRGDEQARLYDEWRQVGLVLGIGAGHLPPDLDGCHRHFRGVVEETLTDNETVRLVLESFRLSGVGPPWRQLPEPVWRALRPLGASFLHDATVGTLPATLRGRFGLRWTGRDRRRLQAVAVLVRAASVPLPERLAQYPAGARARRAARRWSARQAAA